MMEMRKTLFLNEEEKKEVEVMVKSLIKREVDESGFEESGGLGVMVETISDKNILFSIYRTAGFIQVNK